MTGPVVESAPEIFYVKHKTISGAAPLDATRLVSTSRGVYQAT